ncbi:MAG: SIR2 family NAD-dependent protein deacylase [Spirochaetia bacterium]
MTEYRRAADMISRSARTAAFTGAGISVESGVPPFRGKDGIWNRYNPEVLELTYFNNNPLDAWKAIREIFYGYFEKSSPNKAHKVLADWENRNIIQGVITQNIDNLHHAAGSKNVIELHGNSRTLICLDCGSTCPASPEIFKHNPPRCSCGGVWKPDFTFFGESLPADALDGAEKMINDAEILLIIGSTGEVYPAASFPREAKANGAAVIEINPEISNYTESVTDLHIKEPAGTALPKIDSYLKTDR